MKRHCAPPSYTDFFKTWSIHYSGRDHIPPPSYNECCNRIRSHGAPTVVPSNQSRQPNLSATLTSFAALTSNNAVVQTFRQQSSNVDNCEGSSDVQRHIDNPAYEVAGAGTDCDNMEIFHKVVKTLMVSPPPSYAELFNNLKINTIFSCHCYILLYFVPIFLFSVS